MAAATYVVALGSNRRGRHGAPAAQIRAGLALLRARAASPIVASRPLGPARRRYANAVALVGSRLDPPALLARLKAIERASGRRPGVRWGPRVLDLDIILWSGGRWSTRALTIPHADFRKRDFVLGPLAALAPDWRDPVTGRTVRQLRARLTRPRPLPNRRTPLRGARSSVGRATDF